MLTPFQNCTPLLQLNSISKTFPGVQALSDVTFDLDRGEIVAVVGENGAGKSTLLKILAGIHSPDRGQVLIDGRPLRASVRDAMELGIRLIHQELNLAEDLTVAENICLGQEPTLGPSWMPFVDRRKMLARANTLLQKVGLALSPDQLVRSLSIAQRQLVEIARALFSSVRILILDEPTSSLAAAETERLLALLEQLRARGVAILYVSHHLQEVVRIANRALILRDGKQVGTLIGDEINSSKLIPLMIGRDIRRTSDRPRTERQAQLRRLEVRKLRVSNAHKEINFQINDGEIVGFAGLVGAGRTAIAEALFGLRRRRGGEFFVCGRPVTIENPIDAIRSGIALVPEDRKQHGLLLSMSVVTNLCIIAMSRLARFGGVSQQVLDRFAFQQLNDLGIRLPSLIQEAANLSGGNQQKLVLAKWLAMTPKVLILDEPTRGVDVGAKFDVYRRISEIASQGTAVLMISSDMEELIAMSDRVIVMKDGQVTGELTGRQICESNILELALGRQTSNVELHNG